MVRGEIMIWQDVVLTIGVFISACSLLPSIFSKNKPSIWTSLMNVIVLYVFVYVNATLNLYGTAIGVFVVGCLWIILFLQKYNTQSKPK